MTCIFRHKWKYLIRKDEHDFVEQTGRYCLKCNQKQLVEIYSSNVPYKHIATKFSDVKTKNDEKEFVIAYANHIKETGLAKTIKDNQEKIFDKEKQEQQEKLDAKFKEAVTYLIENKDDSVIISKGN